MSLKNLQRRITTYVNYRRLTATLNDRFPDVTEEQMEAFGPSSRTCIICREDMNPAAGERIKRIPCGHIFHFGCLQQWLQQQQNCPTCRQEIPVEATAAERAAAAAQSRPDNPAVEEPLPEAAPANNPNPNNNNNNLQVPGGGAPAPPAPGGGETMSVATVCRPSSTAHPLQLRTRRSHHRRRKQRRPPRRRPAPRPPLRRLLHLPLPPPPRLLLPPPPQRPPPRPGASRNRSWTTTACCVPRRSRSGPPSGVLQPSPCLNGHFHHRAWTRACPPRMVCSQEERVRCHRRRVSLCPSLCRCRR